MALRCTCGVIVNNSLNLAISRLNARVVLSISAYNVLFNDFGLMSSPRELLYSKYLPCMNCNYVLFTIIEIKKIELLYKYAYKKSDILSYVLECHKTPGKYIA